MRAHGASGWRHPAGMARLLRTVGIFGGFVVVVAAAFYPIYFRPLLLPEEYRLKVWSDPFGRK
ncbi:small integral membrane protein 20 isoform X2 [Pogoniulus pusillus]|uniref:small integral membrane protein 20 isoform X2 n=1 Tax=Pogoniulus pusillus TaxID=488313 RepID=UPI0030B91F61